MSRRPRLMFLATSSGIGGAERQVHDLSIWMHRRHWDVTAVSMLPLDSAFTDLPTQGIKTASLEMVRARPDPRAFIRFGSMLRDLRPDVLHAHMVHANLLARVSRLIRPGIPSISTMHSQRQGARWRMVAYRATDRLGDLTTVVSDVAGDDAIRQGAVAADRVSTLPNGIDTMRYLADDDERLRVRRGLSLGDRFVWLAVGRFTAAKDYPNLIRAFAELQRKRPGGQLLIAGAGPDEEAIRDLVRSEGLGHQVRLLGLRADVPDLMRAADAFVMSSAWEGLPIALLEAGASSLPVVATDVGGNREALADDVSGFLVPPRDHRALALRMEQVADMEPAEREAMGLAGHELVTSKFDIESVATRWDAIYRQLIMDRSSGRTQRSADVVSGP